MNQQTFVFADIAGFTALTETYGDQHAADVAEAFAARVREALKTYDGECIKTIGDAVMLRMARATDAVTLSLAIVETLRHDHGSPSVRVGMHTGAAVRAAGDWFGAVVNIAARVAAEAARGEVLVTATTRQATDRGQIDFVDVGVRELRNIREPVALYRARLNTSVGLVSELHIDPICRMAVDPKKAVRIPEHRDSPYFCSQTCIRTWLQQQQAPGDDSDALQEQSR